MAISYPLSLPGGYSRIRVIPDSVVTRTESPFSFAQQVQAHPGKRWRAEITTPRLARKDAEAWIAMLLALNGPENTLLIGDDAGKSPRGTWSGTPVVDGGSQTGQALNLRGFSVSDNDAVKAGDWIQLGTGSSARLYKVMQDEASDSSGTLTVDIWPNLRESPSDGQTVITDSPVGVFRLDQSSSPWEWEPPGRTRISFAAVEAI